MSTSSLRRLTMPRNFHLGSDVNLQRSSGRTEVRAPEAVVTSCWLDLTRSGNIEAVNTIRSLWASVQGDPVFMRRVNGWLTIIWLIMIPVSLLTGWISSVTYVAALSLWALVSGHWSAWQAARVEVRQEQEAQHAEQEPVEQRVVDKVLEETSLEPATGP
jgi:hypothetical protein